MTTMAIGQITHLAMMPWVEQPIPEHSILVVASKCCLVGICFRLLVALIAFTVHWQCIAKLVFYGSSHGIQQRFTKENKLNTEHAEVHVGWKMAYSVLI